MSRAGNLQETNDRKVVVDLAMEMLLREFREAGPYRWPDRTTGLCYFCGVDTDKATNRGAGGESSHRQSCLYLRVQKFLDQIDTR